MSEIKLPGWYHYKIVKRKKEAICKICSNKIMPKDYAVVVEFCYDIPQVVAILCLDCETKYKNEEENKR